MEKKNPYVTTIGFKKEDPDHQYVAELLNSMTRGKAQFLVRAVISYQEVKKKEEDVSGTTEVQFDYESVRRIVYQILAEREQNVEPSNKVIAEKIVVNEEENLLMELDDNALNGILASINAFKGQ